MTMFSLAAAVMVEIKLISPYAKTKTGICITGSQSTAGFRQLLFRSRTANTSLNTYFDAPRMVLCSW